MFDTTLAPEGVHVMSMFTQWVPAEWADERHEEELEAYADRLIDRMNAVAPNFKGSIMHRQIIGPQQMQQDWGLIGGNIFHGELTVDQLFHMRPAPGYADYRTPIRGLYQASSATHAGGGVNGHARPPLRSRDPEGQGRSEAEVAIGWRRLPRPPRLLDRWRNGVETERDAFVQRIHEAALGFFDVLSIRLGDRLGLYAALAEGALPPRPSSPSRARIADRYAREWLEQQTAAGNLRADGRGHGTIRFSLPVGHAEVLLDRDSLSYMTPTVRSLMTLTPVMDALVDAYRTGGGVSWDAYGTDSREAVGDSNRPIYLQVLPREWLPKIPRSTTACARRRRLVWPTSAAVRGGRRSRSQGRIPACGWTASTGTRSRSRSRAVDAETSGVADRVSFEARDAGEPGDAGAYDVVTFFECLHDMSRPVDALRVARGLLTGGGVVFVADEPTNDEFIGAEDDLDRYHYGWSVFACLPTAMVDPGSAGTGTVMRPSTLRSYAVDAGFSGFDVLPIEDDSFRLYLLRA